ncbi:Ig-like domain repeat protein [Thermococcus sp. JdF3]|uniref:Ig-like domain repeat protein n=1 Tax=Thermococcus sp. JdF3 TaxID=1638258 RepID=UPI001439BBD4|nr:Ig-like domain repeat protein [Thermococcus sp. JdF3]NJE00421.1 hypothetical protein [Thermococcus sp. JdF3]
MRRLIIPAVIIGLLLLTSPPGLALERQVSVEESQPSDGGIYDFLSILIDLSESLTGAVLDESNASLGYLERLGFAVNETSREVLLYRERGVSTRLDEYFPPFIDLYRGVDDIVEGQLKFMEYFPQVKEGNSSAYLPALHGVELGMEGVSRAREALGEIAGLSFRTSSGNVTLDTSGLAGNLDEVERLFERYEALLRRYQPPESPLVLYVSDDTPPIGSNVTVYGVVRGMGSVTLHMVSPSGSEDIAGVLVRDGSFSRAYTLGELGLYRVFATGYLNGSPVRSNTVEINVTRIPTRIVAGNGSAYIGRPFQVTAVLQDYLGRPIAGETVFVRVPGGTTTLRTDRLGYLRFNVTSGAEGAVHVVLTYPGSGLYGPSRTNVSVLFTRYPLRITLGGPERVRVGRNFTVTVNVTSAHPVPVSILVDNSTYAVVNASAPFNVSVVLDDAGMHSIAAVFSGDSLYAPSRSNVLSVEAVPGPPYLKFLLMVVVIAGALLIYRRLSGGKAEGKGITDEELVALLRAGEDGGKKRGKRLNEYYRHVYLRLLSRYNLRRSTTPRELLTFVRGEPFEGHLTSATDYHERYTYAGRRLTAEEIVDFIRSTANVLLKLFVGDEL